MIAEKKYACCHCIREKYLSEEIRIQGQQKECSYCKQLLASYSVEKLADRVEEAFEQHYIRTPDEPTELEYPLLKESKSGWYRDGSPILEAIMEAADISEGLASDIQEILEEKHYSFDAQKAGIETEFSSDSCYEEKGPDDREWQFDWEQLEYSLKAEARFFSDVALSHLKKIFQDIEKMKTLEGFSPNVAAGPGTLWTAVYRARVFQAKEKLEEALKRPDLHLGSPPLGHAKAGRMNAHGISVFYGANNPDVAISEVRPPVGSQVAVARFEIIKPIKLLDLSAFKTLSETGSIFDPAFIYRLERAAFLRRLSQRIIRPVMPDDEQFEYIATQAVADFLSTETIADGIIFPSVQQPGDSINIVLFHPAAKIEEIELPEGTEIDASLDILGEEEDWYPSYQVFINVPKKEKKERSTRSLFDDFQFTNPDWRTPTLRTDLDSITVHVIRGVSFEKEAHKVSRHRFEKTDHIEKQQPYTPDIDIDDFLL